MKPYKDRLRFYREASKPRVDADPILDKLKSNIRNRVQDKLEKLTTFNIAGSMRQNPVNERYTQHTKATVEQLTQIQTWRVDTAPDFESLDPSSKKSFGN